MSDKSRNTPPNTAPRLPFAPPPKSVRTLRLLVRLRNAMAWCFGVGLSGGTLTLFLMAFHDLDAYAGLLLIMTPGIRTVV
jgi:hypothetical protein